MISSDPFSIPQETRDRVFAMAEAGESTEAMAQRMADARVEKIAAIKLLRQATGGTLYEAKAKIHCSEAYSYRRASDDAFHDSIFRALEEEGLLEPEVEADTHAV